MVPDDASGIMTGYSKPQRMYGGRDYLKNPEWQNHEDQATIRRAKIFFHRYSLPR